MLRSEKIHYFLSLNSVFDDFLTQAIRFMLELQNGVSNLQYENLNAASHLKESAGTEHYFKKTIESPP